MSRSESKLTTSPDETKKPKPKPKPKTKDPIYQKKKKRKKKRCDTIQKKFDRSARTTILTDGDRFLSLSLSLSLSISISISLSLFLSLSFSPTKSFYEIPFNLVPSMHRPKISFLNRNLNQKASIRPINTKSSPPLPRSSINRPILKFQVSMPRPHSWI